jgi:hypothetical protein
VSAVVTTKASRRFVFGCTVASRTPCTVVFPAGLPHCTRTPGVRFCISSKYQYFCLYIIILHKIWKHKTCIFHFCGWFSTRSHGNAPRSFVTPVGSVSVCLSACLPACPYTSTHFCLHLDYNSLNIYRSEFFCERNLQRSPKARLVQRTLPLEFCPFWRHQTELKECPSLLAPYTSSQVLLCGLTYSTK